MAGTLRFRFSMCLGGAPRNCYVAAKYWKERTGAAQVHGDILGEERYLEVKYEHLLTDPVSVFRKILGFECFEGNPDQVIERFREGTQRMFKKDNFNKWKTKLSVSEIRVFEQIAGDKLKELGYEVQNEGLIGKPVRPDKMAYYHLHNLFSRAMKEGPSGVFLKLKYEIQEVLLKLRFFFSTILLSQGSPE